MVEYLCPHCLRYFPITKKDIVFDVIFCPFCKKSS